MLGRRKEEDRKGPQSAATGLEDLSQHRRLDAFRPRADHLDFTSILRFLRPIATVQLVSLLPSCLLRYQQHRAA